MQLSNSESDIDVEPDNLQPGVINRWASNNMENQFVQENTMETTLEQSVQNHLVAAAIIAGAFVLPCFIAAKLLK